MSEFESLYSELKSEVEQLAGALVGPTQLFIRNRGAFLPHGALLDARGAVQLIMAAPDNLQQEQVSAIEVLPNLHEALRQGATLEDTSALAVCEDVRVRADGQRETRAIKILIEHRRGLCVALYMPFRRKLFGYSFDDMFAVHANPEVNAWPTADRALQ